MQKTTLVVSADEETDEHRKQQLLKKIQTLDQSLDSEKLRQGEDFKRRMEQAETAKAKMTAELSNRHQRELESTIN